ncbi:TRAP-type C4-dicarboxylate transport system permease small subunit [Roseovarius halotolerans]|uniref:TRAP transporter small permease protein n=1 Tax=Roseovarius halotolerans TaxID=505353 RepID=A0A1X6ZY13_9RHOB|nr:TRAP transporter small permease [Roseovarius halotolerans]RKT27701.1 TRAP-type C4-dicarboxylate transport system permease small subunit [Roseovarius halotolerans]SLN64925.1 Tripartite ATP-independent periplasmic transporters, DctQ component [Roseovarius halotolerans]
MSTIEWLLKRTEDALISVSSALIFFMMAFIVIIIFARLAGIGIVGYIDVIELLLPAVAILGISTLQRDDDHLGMDLLVNKISSPYLQKVIKLASLFVGLFAVAILVNKTFLHFLRSYNFGDSTIDAQLPTWPSKGIVSIALGILAVRIVLQLIQECRRPVERRSTR